MRRDLLSQVTAIGRLPVQESNDSSVKRSRPVDPEEFADVDDSQRILPHDMYQQPLGATFDSQPTDLPLPDFGQTLDTGSLWFNPPTSYECVEFRFCGVILTKLIITAWMNGLRISMRSLLFPESVLRLRISVARSYCDLQ